MFVCVFFCVCVYCQNYTRNFWSECYARLIHSGWQCLFFFDQLSGIRNHYSLIQFTSYPCLSLSISLCVLFFFFGFFGFCNMNRIYIHFIVNGGTLHRKRYAETLISHTFWFESAWCEIGKPCDAMKQTQLQATNPICYGVSIRQRINELPSNSVGLFLITIHAFYSFLPLFSIELYLIKIFSSNKFGGSLFFQIILYKLFHWRRTTVSYCVKNLVNILLVVIRKWASSNAPQKICLEMRLHDEREKKDEENAKMIHFISFYCWKLQMKLRYKFPLFQNEWSFSWFAHQLAVDTVERKASMCLVDGKNEWKNSEKTKSKTIIVSIWFWMNVQRCFNSNCSNALLSERRNDKTNEIRTETIFLCVARLMSISW